MGPNQELKWLALSLYPLSFFLYSPFNLFIYLSIFNYLFIYWFNLSHHLPSFEHKFRISDEGVTRKYFIDNPKKKTLLNVLHWKRRANHIFSLLIKVSSIFKTGASLKCHNALGLNFTALADLCFSVALYMSILGL